MTETPPTTQDHALSDEAPTCWEYDTLCGRVSDDRVLRVMNQYGARGWELVAVISEDARFQRMLFKRMIQP